jgi:hypothetical protein
LFRANRRLFPREPPHISREPPLVPREPPLDAGGSADPPNRSTGPTSPALKGAPLTDLTGYAKNSTANCDWRFAPDKGRFAPDKGRFAPD